ncbi:spinster family MFS transporter [Hellea balneolensis]|uniref:spinster family MFS transporter n=1 Tax=Hellea balneolensis TaxID=287478 RepID=UPI000417EAD5|nr:MFS transporter [Hellea balneolensis]
MTDHETTSKVSTKYRTFALLLLTLVYGFNFIDRQIVGILAPWIQADLGLTNTQLGLLVGLAFAAFYTIMGIPLAFLADRMNRVTLLSLALAVWSGFTALTGFAQNFVHIALARVGVGIGEAGGSPPSHSMISDFYAKEERAGALGIYSLGIPLGIMSAYFLTAALLGADAETVNWRRIFITLGVFGIALAIIVKVTIREPVRGAMETGVKAPSGYIPLGQSFAEANLLPRFALFGGLMAILIASWATGAMSVVFFIPFAIFIVTMFLLSLQPGVMTILSIKSWWWMALGIAFASFASYAISGFQTKFLRLLDPEFSPRTFIIWIGIINGTFYVAGTYFGAKLVDWKAKTDIRAYGTIPAIAVFLALPLAIAAFWAPTIALHLAIGAALQLCLGVYLGPSFAIAQTLAPIKLRAMSTALFFFVLNMIALGGGPTFAGAMIDVFLGQGKVELEATRWAMYVTFGAYILAFIFYMFVRISLPKDWAAAEARNESS